MKYPSFIILSVLSLFVVYFIAIGDTVTFGWDANSNEVASYQVHYGTVSKNYSQVTNFGNNLTGTVNNLSKGNNYFFAAKVVGTNQLTSEFSNEINYTVPFSIRIEKDRVVASNVIISWPQNIVGILQYKTNLTTSPWFESPTYTNNPAYFNVNWAPVAFFRVMQTNFVFQPTTNQLPAAEYTSIVSPMQLDGGNVFQTVQTAGNPSVAGLVTYEFDLIEGGNYIVGVDVIAPSGASDSFYVDVNNDPITPSEDKIFDTITSTTPSFDLVNWRGPTGDFESHDFDPTVWSLATGTNTVYFRGREAHAKLNAIYLIRFE